MSGRNAPCPCGSGHKIKKCHPELLRRPVSQPKSGGTYWNGEPTPAERVFVVVGKGKPTWWCHGLEGAIREAVRVEYGGQRFYLDNSPWAADGDPGGSAWLKVTRGRGSPRFGHRSLPVASEVPR